ncbi:hypothetical protein Hosp_041 [Mycobacterium phage Hosp]|uniref:hypothetical protein n=1 Tax=Mycobacterium phage 39HC TaxID=1463809 RepID=UPI0003F20916|nr:hypothetical protein CG91_gp043 [Mycobacterium phage 39HC]YP_009032267.1 hypothetical protein FH38_gp41 [Mycobacterium phage Hosp]AHJ88343.1 hypothetical protein 39HC_043 [Mycobacterium phage 39HC]AHJ88443.1 hypothetical protein 40BC_043 [Mycobacterium phage 40BC]AHK11995.1 hypothetical protein Hosp_041 [Mycobacterium phage Hosp]
MPSPFDKKSGSTATAPAAPAAEAPGLPAPETKGDGAPKSTGAKADPFGNVQDATGISGLKSSAFLGQMVLMHAKETGEMSTSVKREDGKPSPFARVDIIPLTVPEPGAVNGQTATLNDEGLIQILDKDGDVQTFEAYELGEKLEDVLLFNAPLIREAKGALEKGVTWKRGWIVKGNKKPGQSAPYILKALEEDDIEVYNRGLEAARARA